LTGRSASHLCGPGPFSSSHYYRMWNRSEWAGRCRQRAGLAPAEGDWHEGWRGQVAMVRIADKELAFPNQVWLHRII
jgi:hypothetical protein